MTDDHTAFGHDRFGRAAEKAARFFGTPGYIIGPSIAVVVWIGLHQEAVEAALERNTDELRKAIKANTALTRETRDRLA